MAMFKKPEGSSNKKPVVSGVVVCRKMVNLRISNLGRCRWHPFGRKFIMQCVYLHAWNRFETDGPYDCQQISQIVHPLAGR